jgi:hypothetical protein
MFEQLFGRILGEDHQEVVLAGFGIEEGAHLEVAPIFLGFEAPAVRGTDGGKDLGVAVQVDVVGIGKGRCSGWFWDWVGSNWP